MKNVIVFFIILIGFQFIKTHNFLQAEEYFAVTEIKDNSTENPKNTLNLTYKIRVS